MPGKRKTSNSLVVRYVENKSDYKLLNLEPIVNVKRLSLVHAATDVKRTKNTDENKVENMTKKSSKRIDQYFNKTEDLVMRNCPKEGSSDVNLLLVDKTLHDKLLFLEEELCKKNSIIDQLREENRKFQKELEDKEVSDAGCHSKIIRETPNMNDIEASDDESIEILKECIAIAENRANCLNKVKMEPIKESDAADADSFEDNDKEDNNTVQETNCNPLNSFLKDSEESNTNVVRLGGKRKKNPVDHLTPSLSAWLTKAKDIDLKSIKDNSVQGQGTKRKRDECPTVDSLPFPKLKLKAFASLCATKKNIIC